MIAESLLLPAKVLLRSHSYLCELYEKRGLSARCIARELAVSHSTVLAALAAAGLNGGLHAHGGSKGQLPFGYVLGDGRLVKDAAEQAAIRLMRQLRENGKSLRSIAEELNKWLIPTKNHGLWRGATVQKILKRSAVNNPSGVLSSR